MITTQEYKTLALGFLGVGWIGRNRMEAILRHSKASAASIVEPNEENAAEALKMAPDAKAESSFEVMLQDGSLDGVVIATPSALHAAQSVEALKAGKAVFCQKPLGRTAAEVREVVQAAAGADRLLGVDLSYRHVKAFQELQRVISSGEIGEIYAVDLVFHNAYGPDKDWFYNLQLSGGGCVMDLGIHLVDMALWCLDFPVIKEIKSHLCHQGRRLKPGEAQVEDYASVSMTTEEETVINMQCSWHISAGQDAVIEARFYGTGGGAAVKNINGSFYDFTAEKYHGTQKQTLVSPPDNWGGRAGVVWADRLSAGEGHDAAAAEELILTAEIIDRIYGR